LIHSVSGRLLLPIFVLLCCTSLLVGAKHLSWQQMLSGSSDAWLTLPPAGCHVWRRWY